MKVRALIDNDIVIKLSAYRLGCALLNMATFDQTPPAMLSIGRFVVRDRLSKASRFMDGGGALAEFETLLPDLLLLEPTDAEIETAADFETAALRLNLELDGGESQLLAILLARQANLFVTGDKRAILAIAGVTADTVAGRLACLEQLVVSIIESGHFADIREAICREPHADKALTICFGCTSAVPPNTATALAALESYINHVRQNAAGTLLDSSNFSALTA